MENMDALGLNAIALLFGRLQGQAREGSVMVRGKE